MFDKIYKIVCDYENHPYRSFMLSLPFVALFPVVIMYVLILSMFDN